MNNLKELKNGFFSLNGSTIPNDPSNTDYQSIQEWIKSGGEYEKFNYLQQAKIDKLTELKTKLDAELTSSQNSHQAEKILVDELQQETLTNKRVYFLFKTKATGIPGTEPDNLLTKIINHDDPNYHLRYFCDIVEDGVYKKDCFVKLTKALAKSIYEHMTARVTAAVTHFALIKSSIIAATTIEEVNGIEIQF